MNYPDFSQANCIGTDTKAFFPHSGKDTELMAAKRTCANCQIIETCFEWALHHEEHGLWAGTLPKDRREIRRARGIILETPHLALTAGAA